MDTNFAPEPPPADYTTLRRCRALRANGVQCRNNALRGQDLCVSHASNRFPTFPDPRRLRVPLLEDHSSIQLIATQVMEGLLSGKLKPSSARTAFYGCQVVAGLLPRPARMAPAPPEEPIVEMDCDMEGIPVGPREKYKGPTGTFEPQWSMSKYRYEKECERLGKPKPTCAADFPASGWLTEDEIKEDPNHFCDRYEARIRDLGEQKKQREVEEQNSRTQKDQQQPGTVDLQATAETATTPAAPSPGSWEAGQCEASAFPNPSNQSKSEPPIRLPRLPAVGRRENAKRPLLPHREQTPAIPRDEKPTQPPSTLQFSVSSVVKRSSVSSVVNSSAERSEATRIPSPIDYPVNTPLTPAESHATQKNTPGGTHYHGLGGDTRPPCVSRHASRISAVIVANCAARARRSGKLLLAFRSRIAML